MPTFTPIESRRRTSTRPASTSPRTQVVRAAPSDVPAVVAMMRRCSRASLLRRFHGPIDGIGFTTDQLRRNVDILALAWEGPRCVGMGVLAPDAGGVFHLGVLVQDDKQRRGIGTRLVAALRRWALGDGIRRVHADVLGDNHRLVGVLPRLGLTRVSLDHGTFSVEIELA